MLDLYEAVCGADDLRALAEALVRPSATKLADPDGGRPLPAHPLAGHQPARLPFERARPAGRSARQHRTLATPGRPAAARRGGASAASPLHRDARQFHRTGSARGQPAASRRSAVHQPPRRPGHRAAGRAGVAADLAAAARAYARRTRPDRADSRDTLPHDGSTVAAPHRARQRHSTALRRGGRGPAWCCWSTASPSRGTRTGTSCARWPPPGTEPSRSTCVGTVGRRRRPRSMRTA